MYYRSGSAHRNDRTNDVTCARWASGSRWTPLQRAFDMAAM